jgi:hypothetical protein
MKTNHVITIISCSGILGILIGVSGMSLAWMQTTVTMPRLGSEVRTEVNIVTKVDLLNKLRAGRYADATMQMEGWLDGDLVKAAELVQSGGELSQSTLRAVEAERVARAVSGYESGNASVNAAVRQALAVVPRTDPATPVPLDEAAR